MAAGSAIAGPPPTAVRRCRPMRRPPATRWAPRATRAAPGRRRPASAAASRRRAAVCASSRDPEPGRGRVRALRFRIVDADGRTVRDFDVEHTKRMHLIVVRRDLTGFQHLHPAQAADGTLVGAAAPARRPAPTACSPTSRTTASRARSATDLRVDGAADLRAAARRRRRPRSATAATASACDAGRAHAGQRDRRCASRSTHGRPARRDRALPRRRRPPRRAARGRSRLPARPPHRRERATDAIGFDGDVPEPRAATACSCSSRSSGSVHTAAFTSSRESWSVTSATLTHRAADHRDDLRVVREPRRARAERARRGDARRSTTRPSGPRSTSTRRRSRPTQLVAAVEAAGYHAPRCRAQAERARHAAGEPPTTTAPLRRG